MFVSTTSRTPFYGNATWTSIQYGSDVLVIDPKVDRKACVMCTYFITVASTKPCLYSIMVALESTIPTLHDGQPLSDHVSWLKMNIYAFADTFGSSRDIKVVLTTSRGDAVFISYLCLSYFILFYLVLHLNN